MKRISILLIILTISLTGCGNILNKQPDPELIKTYKDIPGVTEEEIIKIERLKRVKGKFSYGHLIETEAFLTQNGTYEGFTINLCGLLSELFEIEFTNKVFDDWDSLKGALDSETLDFMNGPMIASIQMQPYYMTHSIAERALRMYTLEDAPELITETDINGLTVGFLSDSVAYDYIMEAYPSLSFKAVETDNFTAAALKLKFGEIDAFVADAVMDPVLEDYDFIRSKEFFSLVYTPVSMITLNSELEPIISVMDKYISYGGIDKLYELYKEGDFEYAKYKLSRSLTKEERAYLNYLAVRNVTIPIGLESDNYPYSFYNEKDGEYQGIAIDVLDEISRLTDIQFVAANKKYEPWSEIFEKLKAGEIQIVTQLLYSDARKDDFLWADLPYASSYYALVSKSDYPNLMIYQVARSRVGVCTKTAYEDMYNEWFPESGNTTSYATQIEAFDALERGEIDLSMVSEDLLLNQTNYREKSGYKVNIRFGTKMDSFFGFDKDERLLCSVVSKAQNYVKTDLIEVSWTSRVFDYSKKLADERALYLSIFVVMLTFLLLLVMSLFLKNKKAEEKAQAASRAKGAFLAHMSHEIRTPLNAVIGMAGIIKSLTPEHEKTYSYINQIILSSHHLLGVLNDVLDMSKIESGKLSLMNEPFSLKDAYEEVIGIIKQRCSEKDINFTTNVKKLCDVTILGDRLRINQVLINLLGNAVKFTEAGGEISFLANIVEEDDKSIRLEYIISDNGIGMTPKQVSKLFIPFEQTDRSIAARFGGTGLGLSISQNLINMMNSEIKAESEQGKGSKFYFELSFEKDALAVEATEEAPVSVDFNGKRILIVEDIEINRIIVIEILAETGVLIDEAEDGQQAVEIFDRSPNGYYDLIFMDIQMPVMDGYEATKKIRTLSREDAKKVPIIAMTANAYKEDVEKSLASGMNGHLSKPVDVDMLMNTMAEFWG